MLRLDHEKVLKLLPERDVNAHKGDFGRILLLCGSRGYTGAAALAAMGALRSGAGLPFLGVPESIYAIEAVKLTEPVVFPLSDNGGMYSEAAAEEVVRRLPQMDAVLIGCGMGRSDGTFAVLKSVLENAVCPVVVDADGINLLAGHMDLLRGRSEPAVLTPHSGEFARLGGHTREDALALAAEYRCVVLLKGHATFITDGVRSYENPTGNPGMAVAGSGDVLAGVLVSLLGQGLPALEAAACAAWLHGAAGDRCAEKIGQYGMLPSDMIGELPRLMK